MAKPQVMTPNDLQVAVDVLPAMAEGAMSGVRVRIGYPQMMTMLILDPDTAEAMAHDLWAVAKVARS